MTLLAARSITVRFGRRGTNVVDQVDLDVDSGRVVGLVGESGSGKTSLIRAIAGVGPMVQGTVEVNGLDVTHRRPGRRQIQMVFQDPLDALDPLLTIADTMVEALVAAGMVDRARRTVVIDELLTLVRLDPAVQTRRPGSLSGGERQRVSAARALASQPLVLLCDEVTSALDLSVQAAVVSELKRLAHSTGLAIVFVSHDLALVSTMCDEIAVMHHGHIVERFRADALQSSDRHPYTQSLLAAAFALGAGLPMETS
jgi:peptide/nickel transport system ATP-binding protein